MFGHTLALCYRRGRFKSEARSDPHILLLTLGMSPCTSLCHSLKDPEAGFQEGWQLRPLSCDPHSVGSVAMPRSPCCEEAQLTTATCRERKREQTRPPPFQPSQPQCQSRSEGAFRKLSSCHCTQQPHESSSENT